MARYYNADVSGRYELSLGQIEARLAEIGREETQASMEWGHLVVSMEGKSLLAKLIEWVRKMILRIKEAISNRFGRSKVRANKTNESIERLESAVKATDAGEKSKADKKVSSEGIRINTRFVRGD